MTKEEVWKGKVGEDRNVAVHLVLGAVDPPAVHPGRNLSASLPAVSLATGWPKPLTLLELGQTGALNSPHPSTGHSVGAEHQEPLLACSMQAVGT